MKTSNASYKDQLSGGVGDDMTPLDFDPEQLEKGTQVELEHTYDPELAQEIAIDHLTEDPKYYEKLEHVEASFLKSVEKKYKRSFLGKVRICLAKKKR